MIKLTFNTKKHTLIYKPNIENTHVIEYPNVTTVKDDGNLYYEVRQRQETAGPSVPILRVPQQITIIEYLHS